MTNLEQSLIDAARKLGIRRIDIGVSLRTYGKPDFMVAAWWAEGDATDYAYANGDTIAEALDGAQKAIIERRHAGTALADEALPELAA